MKIAIIGIGYVGLPLAVEFGKVYQTIGFDIDKQRIKDLKKGKDFTLEFSKSSLEKSSNLKYTDLENDIAECNIYIVTVPTPIDKAVKSGLFSLSIGVGTVTM